MSYPIAPWWPATETAVPTTLVTSTVNVTSTIWTTKAAECTGTLENYTSSVSAAPLGRSGSQLMTSVR